jgi:hypothetical protein
MNKTMNQKRIQALAEELAKEQRFPLGIKAQSIWGIRVILK